MLSNPYNKRLLDRMEGIKPTSRDDSVQDESCFSKSTSSITSESRYTAIHASENDSEEICQNKVGSSKCLQNRISHENIS